MAKRPVDHVACWIDEQSAQDRGTAEYYSVSVCAEDGDEISCDRGSRSRERAWAMACELAAQLGVEAREIDRWGNLIRSAD